MSNTANSNPYDAHTLQTAIAPELCRARDAIENEHWSQAVELIECHDLWVRSQARFWDDSKALVVHQAQNQLLDDLISARKSCAERLVQLDAGEAGVRRYTMPADSHADENV